jgi:hypothetical protein
MEKEKRMLQTCQREMGWRIPQVVWSDRVTNAEVRQKTNVDIVIVAHCLKWKLGGRVARKDQHRWAQATSL